MRYLVLVVEDDDLIRDAVAAALHFVGLRVVTAANGREALDEVEKEWPSLILLDLEMPIMDGESFARQLASEGASPPIILMSGHEEMERIALEIGAVGTLAKPFGLDRLLSRIQTIMHSLESA